MCIFDVTQRINPFQKMHKERQIGLKSRFHVDKNATTSHLYVVEAISPKIINQRSPLCVNVHNNLKKFI